MNLSERQFLDGTFGVKVTAIEQSKFLINLAGENGYPKEGAEPMFEADTYIEYPYYFIEQDDQLQANMYEDGALDEVEEVVDFEALFGEIG